MFWLLAGHALCDFALQTAWMATNKSPWSRNPAWLHVMTAHSGLHGAAVAAVTGSIALGVAEVVSHFAADTAKCRGLWGIHADQAIHVACKVVWAAIAASSLLPTASSPL